MISSPYIVLSYNKQHGNYISAAITRQESAALLRIFQFDILHMLFFLKICNSNSGK